MEILALNPAKRDAGGKFMASTKRSGSSGGGKKRRSTKKVFHVVSNPVANPPKKRSYARRAAAAAGRGAGWLGLGAVARSILPMLAGAVAAKIVAKKFGSGADEDKGGGWDWKDYLIGGLGVVGASLLSRTLMRSSPATSQKILEGGFLILAYKILTQEIAPMSPTVKGWLGEANETGAEAGYQVGDLAEGADGEVYVLGQDYRWRPADSNNRAISAADDDDDFAPAGLEDVMQQPGRLGDVMQMPGRLGASPSALFARSQFPAGFRDKFAA